MRKEKLNELKSYIEEFKTIKQESLKLKNNNFLSIESNKYYLNNGHVIIRDNILKNKSNGSAVIVLPITTNNTIILVIEPRVLTKSGVGIGFPAGYIENNEDAIISAKRELREETGYVTNSDKDIILLKKVYQDEGCSKAYNHIYLFKNCEKKYSQKLDKDEYIKYFECTFEEALELEKIGYIENANSVIALEKAKSLILK